jgi:lysophospholipase L1-like esterase
VFFGDSITESGARDGGYLRFVESALRERRADLAVEIVGAGISGNRVPDLLTRLDRDVLAKKPSHVVVYIGINDVWHSLRGRGTSQQDFRDGLADLVRRIRAGGAEVLLCTPSVIGERPSGQNELDEMLDEYAQISRNVALETGSELVDLRRMFVACLHEHRTDDADRGVLTTDGVHLNAAGNRFVADRMLEALGIE